MNLDNEVLDAINEIAKKLAPKFVFGYYEVADLEQFARCEAIKVLPKYDGVRPLKNFLFCHMRNRLYNLRRDELYRPTCPCKLCSNKVEGETLHEGGLYCTKYKRWLHRNRSKRSIMEIKQLSSMPIDFSVFNEGVEAVDIKDAVAHIEAKLKKAKLFAAYATMKLGGAVSEADKSKLILIIGECLCQMGYEVGDLGRLISRTSRKTT